MDQDYWLKLIVATICGSVIGLERQLNGKPVGIRTSILVCVATATFIDLSQTLTQDEGSARVMGQVVTGVGFLGAGVIMARQGLIIGMTSAAVVWVLAAAGSAIGLNRYGTAIALAVFTVLVLVGVQQCENFIKSLRRGAYRKSFRDK